jgi:sugar phosphate isomerase/epimerase
MESRVREGRGGARSQHDDRRRAMARRLRIGCQTYTWEMLGGDWSGTPDDILVAVASAGYDGVEFSNAMIGDYLRTPEKFAAALGRHGLACAVFAYATTGFTDPAQFDKDLAGAKEALTFCTALKVPLMLGGAAAPSRDRYENDIAQAIHFYRTVAELGRESGVTVGIHPHSHHGSLLESAGEYDRLLADTADSGLMFNPDFGHIVRGGQPLMDCLRRHRERIVHVHVKDVDTEGNWQPLGQGCIDWEAAFGFLRKAGYDGWIVAEEESAFAFRDQQGAIQKNREYLRTLEY